MKETRAKKQSEPASNISSWHSWVNKSRKIASVSTNNFEDLTSYGKISSSDYYTDEKMLQFKKPTKKKSLRKKDKLDINVLEAETISSGLGVGDVGWWKDAKSQAIKDEQQRLERNNAYQFAYAKAVEACKLLRPEQSQNVKTPVLDLRKSLKKARRLALKKQEEKGVYNPQAIAVIASSNPSNETVDDQISTARKSRENKIVFREIEESVWRHRINEEARKTESEDVFIHDDEKRMKKFQRELDLKQMKSSDTPSLSAERMTEAQARMKTPYLVLRGDVKPENFSGLKRKAEQISS